VQIKDIMTKIELAHLSKPLLKACLSEKQWETIKYINQAMNLEYELRRQMLVQRLEVTIQSFQWSDKAKVWILLTFSHFNALLVPSIFCSGSQ